jgi:hypothetical protein
VEAHMKCQICNIVLIKPKTGRPPTYCRPCGKKRNLASIKAHGKQRHEKLKHDVYTKLGYKCGICGEKDPVVLQIDHINNDGSKDRKTFKNIREFYSHILINNPQVQLLCCNCNWRKEHYRRVNTKNAY